MERAESRAADDRTTFYAGFQTEVTTTLTWRKPDTIEAAAGLRYSAGRWTDEARAGPPLGNAETRLGSRPNGKVHTTAERAEGV